MTSDSRSANVFEHGLTGTVARDRAQAQIEALRQRGGVFVEAVRATRMAMALTDPALPGNPIIFANKAFLDLSGYQMEEVLGQQPHFMNGPDTDPEDADRFLRILNEDQDGVVETVQYAKNGSRFVATVLLSGFKGEDGRTLYHFLSWADVTRRVHAEKEATHLREGQAASREREAHQAFLLELGDALRPASDALEIQRAATRALGEYLRADRVFYGETLPDETTVIASGNYARDGIQKFVGELNSTSFGDARNRLRDGRTVVIDDVHAGEFTQAQKAAYVGVDMVGVVAVPLVKNGAWVATLVVHSRASRNWTGREVAIIEETAERIWAAVDRARAEAALRASEEKYRTLFESIDEGFGLLEVIYDASGEPVDWLYLEENPAFVRHSNGLSGLGKNASEFLSKADASWLRLFDSVVRTGESKRIEYRAEALDRWYSALIARVGASGSVRIAVIFDDITQRKRTEAAARANEERQAFLLALSDAVRSQSSETAKLEVTARQLGERLNASCVLWAEHDSDGNVAHIFNGWFADGAQPSPTVMQLAGYDGDVLTDLRAGRTVRVDNVYLLTEERAYAAIAELGVQALLSVPLIVDGRLKVNLSVHQHEARHWRDDEVALVQDVAERLWVEIVRARAEAALRESEAHLETELKHTTLLRELAARLVTEESSSAIYEDILSTAIAITGSDAGTVHVHDPETSSLELLVAQGMPPHVTEHFRRVDASSSTAFGLALRTGRRTFVDFDKDAADEACKIHVNAGYRCAQATPLLARDGKPIGMLSTHWKASGHRLKDDQLRFLDLLARQATDLIEQAQAAANLRKSEERLRQFGEASQDVLWIRDAKTLAWTYLTPAFEVIYGLTRDEALRGDNFRNWLDLVIPEDRAHARATIERVLAGERVRFEYRIRRPDDGAIRWLRDTDFPIRDAHGLVVGLGGIGQDVTSAKVAEESLRASEERLRSAAEVAKFALWDWNVLTGEVTWSDEHYRMEGYAVGETTPSYEAWLARVHPDDRTATERALQRARDTRTEYAHEFRSLHPDGSTHWLSARGRFFYDEAGIPVRMVGAVLETTERRDWEERQKVLISELQHRTFNLMAMVSSTADATIRSSADLAEFGPKFRDRIGALARVQRLLSRLSEEDRVTFDELIRSELDAVGARESDGRVVLDGPADVALRSRTVQTFAMALHELTTNAVKYGALKQNGARLVVRWHVMTDEKGQPWLEVDWRESGVSMPPPGRACEGTGQGRALIEKALPYQLRARTTYDLTSDGVHCTITLPVSSRRTPRP